MKNPNSGYTVDVAKKTVTLTKAFAKLAGVLGSDEQEIMEGYEAKGYKVQIKSIAKNENKETHQGLSIEFMRHFIKQQPDHQEKLEELEHTITTFKPHPYYYGKVKAKFFCLYPDYLVIQKKSEFEATLAAAGGVDTEVATDEAELAADTEVGTNETELAETA
ncbi:MAG: hypothetical protein FWH04_08720 [Oscillospiraceae bacterium]|nr:hypothetical protein [Oscillospiraceae bacterium]